MIDDPKIRQNMICLLGQIEAICYPLSEGFNQGYYDLIDSIDEFQEKIQSMIDNYCEHDWIENQHYQRHCSKCGKNDNQ